MNDSQSEYQYIDSQVELNAFCAQAAKASVLALDTEFVRTRTFYAQLGLIQAYDGKDLVLIDPLVDLDLEPFWELLTNKNIVKVLHSCHEDLEVFKVYSGRLPQPLFDTQIAGQFLNDGAVLGFGAAVEKTTGTVLDKGEARTNWLKRPLEKTQLHYAANDVKYLLPLYHAFNDELISRNLDQYNLIEAELKVEQKRKDKIPAELYQDFGNAWQLKRRELAVLKELTEWRYEVAIKKNLALGFVVKDATLFVLCQRRPSDLASLKNIPDIHASEIRIHGKALLECIEKGKQVELEDCPAVIPRLTDFPEYKQAFKLLKQLAAEASEKHNVPLPLLATKKQLNQWIKWTWKVPGQELPDFAQPWRHALLKDVLDVWNDKYQLDKLSFNPLAKKG
ncbi:ribonuclease D [Psychrosphaera haliotis]|uniref:ribonuclease D n=1 Tax=Psychrosphaera haliotis TaxID=555083 RepID=UPI0031D5F23E